ncbi:MAG: Hpt domain-containing protein, partial [Pseudomonadales bacterium]|nr:Hpt domain-containing protein [Pseudomonadales bacterium]
VESDGASNDNGIVSDIEQSEEQMPVGVEIIPEVTVGVNKIETEPLQKKSPMYTRLDYKKALAMMGGKVSLLDKMLMMFADKYSSADLHLSEYIANKEWVDAQRFAHTVKGISANIAADELASISGRLETEIKHIVQGKSLVKSFDDELLLFSEELKKLLAEIIV